MQRLLERDAQALETLYDRYARPVYSLVLRIARQPASAEEIVQDVFLHLWNNAGRYQASRGPLGPWLLTMARNRTLDFLRLKSIANANESKNELGHLWERFINRHGRLNSEAPRRYCEGDMVQRPVVCHI